MFSQLTVNALTSASVYGLVAIGFGLIYSSARFFHFAHATLFAAGAYVTFLLAVRLGLPMLPSMLVATVSGGLLGGLLDLAIYRPLRRRQASGLVLLLASLGVYVVLQNAISLLFGDDTKMVRTGLSAEGLSLLGARITVVQILMITASIVLSGTTILFLCKTKLGRAIRAVSNDPELAEVSGVPCDTIVLTTVLLGSALGSAAGALRALDVGMTPTMGMPVLIMGVIAAIIGGLNSVPGTALGAILLAATCQFSTWRFGAQWQESVALALLLGFLLFRPQGLLGKATRKTRV